MWNFLQHVWFMVTQSNDSERFLLQIAAGASALHLIFGDFGAAVTIGAVFWTANWLSYRDLLRFSDNIDNVDLTDMVTLLRDSDYARGVLGKEIQIVQAQSPDLSDDEVIALAVDSVEAKITLGQ